MDQYLPYLKLDAERLEVRFQKEHVLDLGALPEDIVVNCTGIFARTLVGDLELQPIRGQVVLVSQPEGLSMGTSARPYDILIIEGPLPGGGDRLDYIVQRNEDLLLGGTRDLDDWYLTARAEQREAILRNCTKLMPELRDRPVIGDRVGLRPYRRPLRLCVESLAKGPVVIHAYGHGGSGVTLSWGTSDDVQSMAAMIIADRQATCNAVPKPRLNAL